MSLSEWWELLHFLRPHWLWMMLVIPIFYVSLFIRENARRPWQGLIEPALLDHLMVPRKHRWRFRPVHLLSLMIVLGSLAAAGPTWRREQPPFAEDKAPLVIALDLSTTMNAVDLNPTRLERVKLKLRDLIHRRDGGRTALFAYADNAYMVLPFTTDESLFDIYLDTLRTNLMPHEGKDSVKALHSIEDFLKGETVPGTILFVTDGIEPGAFPSFQQFTTKQDQPDEILVLGVGTSEGGPVQDSPSHFLEDRSGRRVFSKLDVTALRALSRDGIDASTLTPDDDDIQWIQHHTQHHMELLEEKDTRTRWIDEGYLLAIPLAVLGAFWFRKGWTIRWTAALLAFALLLPSSAFAMEAHETSSHFSWMDIWMTPDQQGRYYFQKKDYKKAAERFADPMWRGLALARMGDYDAALNAFALSDSAEAWFNQGDALAHSGKYPASVEAFRQALLRRPDWKEAKENFALVQSLIPKPKEQKKEEKEQAEEAPNLPPDQVRFDDKGKQGKKARTSIKPVTTADIWMRNIQTSPADFLRRRFAMQDVKERHP